MRLRAGRPNRGRTATCLLALIAVATSAHAAQSDLEAAVKATFVTRFVAFVEWPAESFATPDEPLAVCVAGDDAIAQLVESAAEGERIGVRTVIVRRFAALPAEARCHVLYAAGSPAQSVSRMLDSVRDRPVLTITDERRGRTRGMVHFVLSDGRVRFRIDRNEAALVDLAISARLLSVALSVKSSDAS
jgi:hypothetical protein